MFSRRKIPFYGNISLVISCNQIRSKRDLSSTNLACNTVWHRWPTAVCFHTSWWIFLQLSSMLELLRHCDALSSAAAIQNTLYRKSRNKQSSLWLPQTDGHSRSCVSAVRSQNQLLWLPHLDCMEWRVRQSLRAILPTGTLWRETFVSAGRFVAAAS